MNILFLSHYFPPEGAAGAVRAFAHTKRWVASGEDVTVITCAPHYPTGRVLAGYRNRVRQVETVEGIRVVRVGTYLAANKGVMKRTANYLSYMVMAVMASILERRPDVVIATSGQFFCGLAGAFVSKLLRRPLLLEIRDLWPESIAAVGAVRPGRMLRLVERMEHFMYASAEHIVAVGEGYRQGLIERGVEPERVSIVMNGVDAEVFHQGVKDPALVDRLGVGGRYVVSYCGAIGLAHGLEVVLRAALSLRERGREDIVFLLVGDGARLDDLRREAARLALSNVVFTGSLDRSEIPGVLALSNACLVHLRRSKTFTTVMPSKIFEAAAMSRPVILGVQGFAADFVRRAGCGLCVEPENDGELVDAVLKLSADRGLGVELGRAGHEYVKDAFDRSRLAERYRIIIRSVMEAGARCG